MANRSFQSFQDSHLSDRQNAIQPHPVYSRKVSVLGVRCIGLHGLVHHAVTLLVGLGLSLGVEVGWLFLCRKDVHLSE